MNTTQPKWDTDLMEKQVFVQTTFTAGQRNRLMDYAVDIDKAQEKGNQGLANEYANRYFTLFGQYLRGETQER